MQKFEKHSPVVVTEVTTKHELRQFMQYPNRLYADNPNYIPSFYGDDLSDWTPGKTPRLIIARRVAGWPGATERSSAASARSSATRPMTSSARTACASARWTSWMIPRFRRRCSARSSAGRAKRAATRCTARSASRTWTARVCSSRALTAEACFHQLQRAVLSRAPHPTRLPQGC